MPVKAIHVRDGFYENKKRIVEEELKDVASALGLSLSYEMHENQEGYVEEVLMLEGTFTIPVTMDSMTMLKRDFLEGLARLASIGALPWIYTGREI